MRDDNLTEEQERHLMIGLLASNALASISKDVYLFGEDYSVVAEVISVMMAEALETAADLSKESLKPLEDSENLPSAVVYAARVGNLIITAKRITDDETKQTKSGKSSSNIFKLH